MKLALGTVQFGLDYGISNNDGEVKLSEVKRILAYAQEQGITTLDTASAYGSSEKKLGQINSINEFSIITKIANLNSKSSVKNHIIHSLKKLHIDSLDAVLFHQPMELISSPSSIKWFEELQQLKYDGTIKKLGVSVYTAEQLRAITNQFDVDIVQLPFNCLDQRFSHSGWLKNLHDKKIEIHCRSVFLQGLLLQDKHQMTNYFLQYRDTLCSFWSKAEQLGVSKLELSLAIACNNPYINKIIVGCCSYEQLKEIVEAYQTAQQLDIEFEHLASNDEMLIIPSNWNLGS